MTMIEIGVDYLQGIIKFKSLTDFEDWLDTCSFFVNSKWGYTSDIKSGVTQVRFKSPSGFYGTCKFTDNDSVVAHIFFPGSFCCQMSSFKQHKFTTFLQESEFRFTRFDIRLDDYKRRVSFQEVKKIGESGNYALVETYKCVETGMKRANGTVPTCYFGSGDKMLRFYNSEVVHGIEADRWELQLRDDWARSTVNDYLSCPEVLGSVLVGSVDFVDWSTADRRDRCQRFDWWQSLIDEVGNGYRPSLPEYVPSLQRTFQWLDRQVAVSLAVLRSGLGAENFEVYLNKLCDRGESRFKDYHQAWVEDLQSKEICHESQS